MTNERNKLNWQRVKTKYNGQYFGEGNVHLEAKFQVFQDHMKTTICYQLISTV